MKQQEDVVGSKKDHKDEENNNGQTYCSFLLGCLGITSQLAYDANITEYCDTEGEEEQNKHKTEKKDCPSCHGWEHGFLQHVKACGDAKIRNVIGQVCGHQWVQNGQHQTPHQEAARDCDRLSPPVLSERHGLDDAQVAINSNGHHGQDGTVHVRVENQGQEAIGRYTQVINSLIMAKAQSLTC